MTNRWGWDGCPRLGLLGGPGLGLLSSPPDADHVVARHCHHVLVVVTTGYLQWGIGKVKLMKAFFLVLLPRRCHRRRSIIIISQNKCHTILESLDYHNFGTLGLYLGFYFHRVPSDPTVDMSCVHNHDLKLENLIFEYSPKKGAWFFP